MKYQPKDIKTLEQVEQETSFHQYLGTFDKAEYEQIIGKIVEASQRAGKWVAVKRPLSKRKNNDSVFLEDLVNEGFLETEDNISFWLTEKAIKRLAKKYSRD